MKSLLRYFFFLLAISLFSFQESQARVDIIHISTNDPQCFNSNDGYVTIDSLTVTAPSGPYLIRINTTPTQTFNIGDTIPLDDGNYTITVFDLGDGNTPAFRSFSIDEPFQLVTAIISTTTSCFGACDGDATVFAFDGTPGYSYEWNTTDTTQSIDSLCAGTYYVTVTDANSCTAVDSIIVNEPPLILPNVTVTDVGCFGESTGSATSNPTGGTGTYVNYQWSSSGNNTATEGNLSTGTYTVTVTDDDGCTGVETFNVGQPSAPLNVSISNSNDVDCFGDSTGSATAQATGGTSPYTYQWDDFANQTIAQANNLPAGTYKVVVNDANGCLDSTTVTINQSPQSTITMSATDVNCNGGNDGSATASISGGTPNFSWAWSHGPNGSGSSTTVNNLTIGVYTVTFTDALACTTVDSIAVNEPSPINVQVDNQTDPLCNGGSDGSIDITTTGGTLPYNFSWNGGPTTEDRSGLSAGTYTLIVTDGNACKDTTVITLSDPPLLTASIDSLEDASCNGLSDGYIRVAANGGTGSYTYSWSNLVNTADNPNIPAGSYSVTVTDANGCTAVASGNVSEPALLTASVNTTDASCGGAADGTASVSVNGGTTLYSYLWSTTDTTASIANLTAGTYSVTVTDANGCTVVASGNVGEPTPLNLSLSSTDLLCNGDGSGTASASVSGGTPSYTYLWNDPSNQTTATANNLDAGLYRVTVTDANGCSIVDSINVNEPSVLTANINASSDPSCNGGNDGSATVTAGGGVGAYTYAWNDPSNQTTATASNLSSGTYTVTVSDGNGCTATDQITLSNPLAIQLTTDSISDVSCNGGSDGSIFLTTSNGTPPYNYSWSDGPFTTEDRTGLSASSYTVTVTDNGGCSIQQTFQITEPAQGVSITVDSIADVSCNGNGDGSIDISVSGGTSPYNYLWSDSPTTEDRNGLNGGSYTVTVTDGNGCTSSQSININEPNPLDLSIDNVNDASCNGSANGSATVSATGGTPNYTFNWSNSGSGNTQTNLAAGVYIITVTDANGCQDVDSLVVGSPSAIVISVDTLRDVSCNGGNDGSVTVVANGGTPNYTYNWSNAVPGATNNNLSAGTYIVTVTDANNCSDTLSVNIGEPQPLTVALNDTDESCVGEDDGEITANGSGGTTPYTYLWSNSETTQTIDSLSPGTYSVTITDANGCTTGGSATINAASAILFNASASDVSCNGANDGGLVALAFGGAGGFSYLWSDGPSGGIRTNVAPGPYTVTATDANGCTAVASVTINEPDSLIPTLTVTDASCSGASDGSASVSTTGGTPSYTYNWSAAGAGNTSSVSNLAAGNYSLTVSDANGCDTVLSFSINQPVSLNVSVTTTDETCSTGNDGTATANVSGGNTPYGFLWSTSDTTSSISGLSAGNYQLTVTDANGCDTTLSVTINSSGNQSFDLNDSIVDATCGGNCNGEIILNPTGGDAPYSFLWSDNTSLSSIDSLCAGSHGVTVTDNNGCTTVDTFFITTSSAIVTSINFSDDTCLNAVGSATVLASGGTPPYNYNWSSGGSTSTESGLVAGTYIVTVTDFNNCTAVDTAVLGNYSTFTSSLAINDVSCFEGSDGSITVSVTGGTNPMTYDWSNGLTGAFINNLEAGTYFLTVSDASGCAELDTAIVNEPAEILITINSTDESCSPGGDGTATASVTGGTPPYTYNWSAGTATGNTTTGLLAGNYQLTVTDSENCVSSSMFTITTASPFSVSVDQKDAQCNGGNDGEIDLTISGGITPYSFNWSSALPSQEDQTGLTAGNYSVTITDGTPCSEVLRFRITEEDPFVINLTTYNASCTPGNDGSAKIEVSGGVSPYSYNWSGGTVFGDSVADLSAGSYSVTVTDDNGCTKVEGLGIIAGSDINPGATTTPPTCFGGSDGSISLNPTGSTNPNPSYTYLWDDNSTQSTRNSLSAGVYRVTISDNNTPPCERVANIVLTQPGKLSANFSTTVESCNPGSDGTASVSVNGGTPPYSYAWSAGTSSGNNVSGLSAGSYTVTVTDDNGCQLSKAFTIDPAPDFNVSLAGTNASCFGGNDGTIAASVSGATNPLTYDWQPPVGGGATPIVSAGMYYLTVTDGLGCQEIDSIEIGEAAPIQANVNVVDESCASGGDGSASVSPTDGVSPYTFLWSENSTTSSISSLNSGVYYVTITDANGCSMVDSADVSSGQEVQVNESITDVSCKGSCDGSIILSPTGGQSPYTYNWSTSSSSNQITGLCEGSYSVTVTDNNGCSNVETINVGAPAILISTISTTDESCSPGSDATATANPTGGTPPYSFNWSSGGSASSEAGLASGTYTVTITDDNGCTTVENFSITQPNSLTINVGPLFDVSCNGASDGEFYIQVSGNVGVVTYDWGPGLPKQKDQFNLSSGTYTVTVTDSDNGCTQTASGTIDEPTAITATTNTTAETCVPGNDGTISINPSGGTVSSNYTYTWNKSLPPTQTQTGLSAGQYIVTVTDDNGCELIDTVNVGNVAPYSVSISSIDVSCNGGNDGSIDLTVSGVTGTPTFNWDNGLPPTEDQNNLVEGNYNVTVTDTSTGCIETALIIINEPAPLTVNVSTTAESCSPGSDGAIDLTVSGGTVASNYSFNWDNGLAAQEDQNGLQANTYNVTITDDNGCSISQSINVGSVAPFTIDDSITDVSCNGGADGAIDLTIIGAGANPTYTWSNGLAAQEDQNGLLAGNYSVTVTDPSSGCTATASYAIVEPDTIQTTIAITDESCSPGNDGRIIMTVSGGTVSANYSYQWTNALPPQRNQVNLSSGTYTVTITDDNGCFIVKQINVGSIAPFSVDSVITDATCNGGSDGAINLTINGSGGSPTFSWSNSLPAQEDQANLKAGTYSVTITDPNSGCTSVNKFSVDEPNPIQANFNITPESCSPGSDGAINAIVNGGTSPYSFIWSNNGNTQSISNLSAGKYYLTITDISGCVQIDSATVGSSAPFTVTSTTVDVSCNGGSDGLINLSVTGTGSSPTFSWSNGLPAQANQTGLTARTYQVTVTDPSDGCTETASISINEPSPISVNITEVPTSCNGGGDGSATASASGGTPPYSYAWSNSVFTPNNTALSVGVYQVTITDDNGCTLVDSATINQGSALSVNINVIDESCTGNCDGIATVNVNSGQPPYSYSWSFGGGLPSRGGLCAGNYSVTVTDAVGCDTVINFNVGSGIVNYTIASANESCLGSGCDGTASISTTGSYTYNWSPAPGAGQGTNQVSGLCAGKYFVTISNGSGCNVVDSVEIDPYSPILPNEVVINESCGASCDGEISLNPSGGASSNYTYNWSPIPPNGQGVQTATGLCTGTYNVTITSPASCDTALIINIQSGNTLTANITTQDQSCGVMTVCDGSAYATVTSGQAPYTYNWSVGTPTGPNGDTILSVCTGNDYTVTITDVNGCSVVDTFDIGGPTPITAAFSSVNSTCNICDGELTVNANGGSGNYSYLWFDQNMDTLTSTNTTITSLCAGVYFVEITDDNGCSVMLSTSLSDNGAESLTVSATDATCFGSCDGEASVNFNCSDPSCQIDWINASTGLSIGQSGNTASGLCAGDYFVEVTNNSGCIALESITIAEPSPFVISENISQSTCASSCSGSISLNVSGGSGGTYNYNWSPAPGSGQGTSTISNLCAGSYQVTVSDASGCDTVLSYIVGAPAAMTATFSTVNANCGQSDGSITATVNGGTVSADYIYQWFDGANNLLVGETDPIIDNISAGNYTLRTEDDNQCVEFFTTVLGNIGGPSIIVDSIQNVDCYAANNGAAAISVSGGTAPYTYDWLPSGASTEDLSGVLAGTYTIKVTDGNGCISTESIQINDGSQLDGIVETTNAACGACDGTAKLSLTGGSGAYTYLWSNGSTIDSTSNLCSGSHSVVATDSLGCSETFYFTINNNDGPSDVTVTATAASCATACDGTVQLQPIGGLSPYTYSWMHSPLDTNAFDNLCIGDYTVQVTDVRGCAKVVNFSIGSPAQLSVSETITASACNTFPCDGSIFLNVKGGTEPYTYNWGPTPQNDSNFIGDLCAGIYSVTVSDANGCTEMLSMNVSNNGSPVSAEPTTSPESCFGSCDGSLVSGLTPSTTVSFQWLNSDGLAVTAQDNDLIGSACAGDYFLEVTSLPDGCITTYAVEVEAADSISLSASVVKPISCLDACDGIVSVSSKGGELTFSYSWNDPNGQNVIPAEGLCAGTYTVTATDANGCSETLEVTLRNPDTLELDILAEGNVGCSSDCDGTASVLASGGNAPYSYNWSEGQTGTDPTNLCFGPNVITVTDATGCSISDTVYISATDTVVAQVPTDSIYCEGDSIFLNGTIIGENVISFGWYNADTTLFTASEDTTIYRGVGDYRFILIATDGSCADTSFYDFSVVEKPSIGLASSMAIYKDEIKKIRLDGKDSVYQYRWNPSTNLDDSTLAEPTTDTRETITYVLSLLDTTGCSISDSIRVVYYPDLEVPSGFSPNGDGTNDVWNIRLLEEFPNASVTVYNRWGELLFEQTNGYKEPWDGKFNGKILPVGTYYYVIDLKDSRYENLTGPITLIK